MRLKASSRRVAALAVLVGSMVAVGAIPAVASAAFAFDPVLSLTGGCTTSPQDPVADPSCPGPPLPPSGSFNSPRAIATDTFGDIFVASYGKESGTGDGRVDVFNAAGEFLTEISGLLGPKSLAVDSEGYLYVFQHRSGIGAQLERFKPSVYKPEEGEIAYGNAPVTIVGSLPNPWMALAVNPENDHLFALPFGAMTEYTSAEDGNAVVDSVGPPPGFQTSAFGLALDSSRGRLYRSLERSSGADPNVIQVLELAAPYGEIETIDGSDMPEGRFRQEPALAVDEATGHIFAYYESGQEFDSVYELTEEGEFLEEITHELKLPSSGVQPAVDNGVASPNKGYLFVPSRSPGSAIGHSYAFEPAGEQCAPTVESVSFVNVGETEAELRASIKPCGLPTDYSFEITTRQAFEDGEFSGATIAGTGQVPAGSLPVDVGAAATGLTPGADYVFRLVATNEKGSDEEEGAFSTYPANPLTACPNDQLRTGFSRHLPDCRAFELVTPPDTNARSPHALSHNAIAFPGPVASPDGGKVSFQIEGGTIPGFEGSGSLAGDPYLSVRGPSGWSTAIAGPNGAEAPALVPGSTSPDQGHSFWATGGDAGSASIGGQSTTYVRYPDGHSALIGRGTLADDPRAEGKLISENGAHIIFVSKVRLEENAPSGSTVAIYDRTADEVTHVVSLLPGDETPSAGSAAKYLGASLDGRGVAFEIGGILYLRHDNAATYEVGPGVTFAGVAEGGGRIFYVEGGNLKALDIDSGVIPFTTVPNTVPVNVSADGTAAYSVSTSVVPKLANPLGQKPKAGLQNLYLSREGVISFIGIVTTRDVAGEYNGNEFVEGLGLWVDAVSKGTPGKDPSRSTPNGDVLLFESRANLTGYDPEGQVEVFRYEADGNTLQCLSCNPTGAAATESASLESTNSTDAFGAAEPLTTSVLVNNLTVDGARAFFQSTEPLVAADTDGLQDVYEWEDQGTGSCTRLGGCVYLISSGQSLRTDYLYAVSDSGDDVFFRSADLLVPADQEETPSLYDARVGGGFTEQAAPAPCEGEGCRSGFSAPPAITSPAQPATGANDNVTRRCPKGKHRVSREGKVRCVKKQKRHHRSHSRHSRTEKKGAQK